MGSNSVQCKTVSEAGRSNAVIFLRSFLSGDSSFCAVSHKNTNIFNFDVKYQSLLL